MTKELIEQLALEAYPEILDHNFDENYYEREIYISALEKAASILYTEVQIKSAYHEGGKAMHNKCIEHDWKGKYVKTDKELFDTLKTEYIKLLKNK